MHFINTNTLIKQMKPVLGSNSDFVVNFAKQIKIKINVVSAEYNGPMMEFEKLEFKMATSTESWQPS